VVGLPSPGVFVSDPAPHDHATWHGTVHNSVSLVVFVALAVACFTAARWRPGTRWRWYCRAIGVAVLVLFVIANNGGDLTGVWQRLTIMVGWSWLAVLNLRALRTSSGTPAGTPLRTPEAPRP
jgi:uncharacterized protein DUF998